MKPPVLCLACQTPDVPAEGEDNRGARRGALLVPETPVAVTDRTFDRVVAGSPPPVLPDLWAPWCGTCRTTGPILEDLSRKYHGRLGVAKPRVDENPYRRQDGGEEHPSPPDPEGRIGGRLAGAHPAQEIKKGLRSIL